MPSGRRHYTDAVSFFRRYEWQDLAHLDQMVQSLLREQGTTLSLLGDEAGLERTLPLDPFPRVIPPTNGTRSSAAARNACGR